MYLNLFNTGHALPLRQRRILHPPIFRQFSGGNDAEFQTAIYQVIRRIAGGISGVHPPDHPAKLPGNLRAIAGRLISHHQVFARPISRMFPPHYRRSSGGIVSTCSGHSPASFPSYARH